MVYNWSNGSQGPTISNVEGGVISVTATDGNACQAVSTQNVNENGSFAVTANVQKPQCSGYKASIGLNVPPGSYTYRWSDGSQGSSLFGVSAGKYQVTVTSSSLCKNVLSFDISEPPAINISQNKIVLPNCFGTKTGSISINVSGGTIPYTYRWSNNATTKNINNLATGTYTVFVKDSAQCDAEYTLVLLQPPLLNLSAQKVDDDCGVANTGSISAIVSGGTQPYSYKWSNGSTANFIDQLAPGNYTLTLTDGGGCSKIYMQDIITLKGAAPSIPAAMSFCKGDTLTIDAGLFDTYKWSNGNTSQSIKVIKSGTYTVSVTNNGACKATAQTVVSFKPAPSSGLQANIDACQGTPFRLNAVSMPNYNYLWSDSSTLNYTYVNTPGKYYVMISNVNNGCINVDTMNVNFIDMIKLNLGKTRSLCDTAAPVILDAGVFSRYLWSTGDTIRSISSTTPGTYTANVTNAAGCTSSASVNIVKRSKPIATFKVNASLILTSDTLIITYSSDNQDSCVLFTGEGTKTIGGCGPIVKYQYTSPGAYKLKLITINDCGADTAEVLVIVKQGAVGIKESSVLALQVYPNPSTGLLHLDFGQQLNTEGISYKLMDISGRTLLNSPKNISTTQDLNLSALEKGLYQLVLYKNGMVVRTEKIVLQ